MKNIWKKSLVTVLILCVAGIVLFSCKGKKKRAALPEQNAPVVHIHVPDFNVDSAYHFVVRQVEFGPRVPNTPAHEQCAQYLVRTLKGYTPDVMVQQARVRAYHGMTLNIKNIIASFNKTVGQRFLLCAHWDSRPYADHDPDPLNHRKPIDGANDGASGVGVLLEVARQLYQTKPAIGVDIILFDAEDYGEPEGTESTVEEPWALGSQHWAKNPHVTNYSARFGILLDMVGVPDATFAMEGTSMYYAPDIMRKVWETASRIGFSNYFVRREAPPITDDHLYINQIINIPTIDIIHLDQNTQSGFFKYWHTLKDNIHSIDKNTLKAVGQTILTVIFEESAPSS